MDAAASKALLDQISGRPVAGWNIGEIVGIGGSATVFCARKDHNVAAVKIIDPSLESEFGPDGQQSRVELESQLIGTNHPNLIKILEAGRCKDTGYLYIAMEYLNGYRKLSDLIGTFPREKIGPTIEQIAAAAEFLDNLSICHRDIKPDNIMVSSDISHVVLMDMGIISPFSEQGHGGADPSGERFIGTARYSPPEFVRKQEDKSSEGCRALTIYQLGAVLHDLIMRERIFADVNGPYAVLIDAVTERIPVVNAEDVATSITFLARDCLQKSWRKRLALVSFSRFSNSLSTNSVEARARVRAMLRSDDSYNSAREGAAVGRSTYLTLARKLRDSLRSVFRENSDLPQPALDFVGHPENAVVTVDFERSPSHQLLQGVRVTFTAASLEGDDAHFSLDASANWSADADTDGERAATRLGIIRGMDDDMYSTLEDYVFRVMASAMAQPAAGLGSKLRVE